jgi:hypothetical protein
MIFKDSTIGLQSLKPQLLLALIIVDQVMQADGQQAVITSLNDARHSKTSLHYNGSAADLRSRFFDDPKLILELCKKALGNNPDLDMIYEGNHFHLEYQPKRKGE